MKRRFLSLLAVLALILSLAPSALAAQPNLVVAMRYNSPWCVIGDTVTQIDPDSSAVVVMAEAGRTMLPIRRMIEAFEGVRWSGCPRPTACGAPSTVSQWSWSTTHPQPW